MRRWKEWENGRMGEWENGRKVFSPTRPFSHSPTQFFIPLIPSSPHPLISFLLLLLAVSLMFSCSSTWASDKLIIVSPHPESIQVEFSEAFRAWCQLNHNREVQVEWLDQGGTSNIVRFIRSEFKKKPNGIGVDLFFGGGSDVYMPLAKEGLYQSHKIPAEILAKIPKQLFGVPLYDENYLWYGTVLSGFGIMCNKPVKSLLKLPNVRTWADLANPNLFSYVGAADLRGSGSAHMVYEIILQAYGWEKGLQIITEIGGNVRNFPNSASQVPKDVALGEAVYGMAIDFYAYALMAEAGQENVSYINPEGQTVINPDPIAILKGAPNLDLAQKFIDFVMSEKAQKLWMLPKSDSEGPKKFNLNRMSVIPELYEKLQSRTIITVNPFKLLAALNYDPKKGGMRWTLVNDLIGALVIDMHHELKEAWKETIKSGLNEAARKELALIPITEEEALALSQEKWKDPAFRNEKISYWVSFAKAKYQRAKRLAKEKAIRKM